MSRELDAGFYRQLVEKGSDAIVSIDEESTVVFANESVERVLGYRPEELRGEPLTAVMPERFQEAHHEAVASYLATGDRQLDWTDIRLPAEHADGHEVPLSITFEEHVYEGERIFSGIMRDVSRQEAYEHTLRTLQETATDLMRARTPAGIGERVVSAVEETLEYPLAALFEFDDRGRLRPLAHTDALERAVGGVPGRDPEIGPDHPALAAVRDGAAWTYGVDHAGIDGLDVERAAAAGDDGADGAASGTEPLVAAADPAVEVVVPVSDRGCLVVADADDRAVDERTVRPASILAANAEAALSRAARERELERQNERLERFASIVSHDLRDPLNAARAQTTLLRAEDGDAEYLDELESIHDRMAQLVEDVLALTKSGLTIETTEPLDPGTVAREAWRTAAPDADAELVVESASGARRDDDGIGVAVDADPGRLRTLLENLLGNAVKHGGAGVTVRVGPLAVDGAVDDPTAPAPSSAGFYVEDDGPGVPADERGQVFEYGYTDGDGTGFGLSIVREVAEAHGWEVAAVEGRDGGARFEVRCGRGGADPDADATPEFESGGESR